MIIKINKEILKLQVKTLRNFLKEKDIEISQSSAYEVISKMYGYEGWNFLSNEINNQEGTS
jgi:Glyoxalase superfamily protein